MLRKKKFDVIFVYAPSPILQAIPAIFLGWLKGCPVALWVQDLWPESLSATGHVRNQTVLRIVEWVVRFIYRHTNLLLVQSRAFEKPVRVLASNTPITYYPNSVDEAFCVPSTVAVPEIPGLSDGFSVMFAGNIGVAQAVEIIVEAATLLKQHADIRFVVLGQGSRWEWMREQARKLDLTNLHLPGHFPVETMPGLMQQASALLVTLTDQPIFAVTVPNKVQAYMASGKPIIACLNGEGARVVTEAKAGLAVPAGDAQGLVEAILRLYEMTPAQREKLGSNGQQYYKAHFNHDQLVDQLIEHLQVVSKSI
jgi:glycosyltransferase involved in cell wall biosynthesis